VARAQECPRAPIGGELHPVDVPPTPCGEVRAARVLATPGTPSSGNDAGDQRANILSTIRSCPTITPSLRRGVALQQFSAVAWVRGGPSRPVAFCAAHVTPRLLSAARLIIVPDGEVDNVE